MNYMRRIPYTKGGVHKLLLHLGADAVDVVSVRLWNYNKSPDDAARGTRFTCFTSTSFTTLLLQQVARPRDARYSLYLLY